jgi:hypothetical protein
MRSSRVGWKVQLLSLEDVMDRRSALPLILLASCSVLLAQKAEQENKVPTPAELQAITARGKMLAEYDVASWHATDAVQDLKPKKGSTRY